MPAARAPQDYQAPAKRPARRRPAAGAGDKTTALQAEADADYDGYITVPLDGVPLRIMPEGQWRQSTNDALTEGRFNVWASLVMPPEDHQLWRDMDPTNDQVLVFFEDWGKQSGSGLGDRNRSATSSRSTRRR